MTGPWPLFVAPGRTEVNLRVFELGQCSRFLPGLPLQWHDAQVKLGTVREVLPRGPGQAHCRRDRGAIAPRTCDHCGHVFVSGEQQLWLEPVSHQHGEWVRSSKLLAGAVRRLRTSDGPRWLVRCPNGLDAHVKSFSGLGQGVLAVQAGPWSGEIRAGLLWSCP